MRDNIDSMDLSDSEPVALDRNYSKRPSRISEYEPVQVPDSPVVHEKTGVVLMASCRVDGVIEDPPWSLPEPVIFEWLRSVKINKIDESISPFGTNGALVGYAGGIDGERRCLLLRFDTVGFDEIYESLGEEYNLSVENHDILKREQSSYELCKSIGCEDIVAPVAAIETNLVPLISDDLRSRVSEKYDIDPLYVDEKFGIVALAQLLPLNGSSFAEYWAMLGADNKTRFARASDSIRHSIYRFLAVDFILGTANRTLADLMVNRATDGIVVYGFGPSMPNPSSSADWYLKQKASGWKRRIDVVMRNIPPSAPVSGSDVFSMMNLFEDKQKEECLATFRQIGEELDEDSVIVACRASLEYGVPVDNLAGAISRLIFLQEDPELLIQDKFSYMSSFLVPLRKKIESFYPQGDKIVNITNQIISSATGQEYDFTKSVSS